MWAAIQLWPPHLFVAASHCIVQVFGSTPIDTDGFTSGVHWTLLHDTENEIKQPYLKLQEYHQHNNVWLNHRAACRPGLGFAFVQKPAWTFPSAAVKGLMGMRGTAVMWGWKLPQLQLSIIYLLSILHPNVHIIHALELNVGIGCQDVQWCTVSARNQSITKMKIKCIRFSITFSTQYLMFKLINYKPLFYLLLHNALFGPRNWVVLCRKWICSPC